MRKAIVVAFSFVVIILLAACSAPTSSTLATGPTVSSAPVTTVSAAPSPTTPSHIVASTLPAPGQPLMPLVVATATSDGLVLNTVQVGSAMDVALVEFGMSQTTYQRYATLCEQLKTRDGLPKSAFCDNQLALGKAQCQELITAAPVRDAIIVATRGVMPPTIICQVIARVVGAAN